MTEVGGGSEPSQKASLFYYSYVLEFLLMPMETSPNTIKIWTGGKDAHRSCVSLPGVKIATVWVCWCFYLRFLLQRCDSTLFATFHLADGASRLCDCVSLTRLPYPWPSTAPLCVDVCAVRAACGLHAVLLADQDVCVCVRMPNPWLHASSESPLDNEAEIKGERKEERQTRGRREDTQGRKDEGKRDRWRENV